MQPPWSPSDHPQPSPKTTPRRSSTSLPTRPNTRCSGKSNNLFRPPSVSQLFEARARSMAIVATALCRRQSPCRNRPVADYAPASRLLSQYAALIMLTRRMSNHPPVLQFLGPREIFSETSRVIFSRSSVSLPGPFLGADLAVKRSLGANTGA